jgi:hypothetical protein
MKLVMKSSVFWHITHCSPLKVNRRFGVTSTLSIMRVEEASVRARLARHYHQIIQLYVIGGTDKSLNKS